MSRKLAMQCPHCGGMDVFYSCEPKCCFNHVCADCRGTFEPVTRPAGGRRRITPPTPLPDASDPTVACSLCESTEVYQDDDEALVCSVCGSTLALEFTEVCPP